MSRLSWCAIAVAAAMLFPKPMSAAEESNPFKRAALLRDAGRAIFSDAALSSSGKQSCASCHAPDRRYNPPNARDIQPGGKGLDAFSFRAPPTLTYLNRVPAYSNHYHESDDEGDESIDNGPTGGLTWDGRVDGGAHQAALPLLADNEMGGTKAGIAAAAREASYAKSLRDALAVDALDTDASAFAAVVRALGAFEEDYTEFNPYTSKYDAYLTGRATLTKQEKHGLDLFNDEKKGNCAQCHISKRGLDGGAPALSDYGLIALGVPRNPNIADNRDPAFFDLGACGPLRTDKANDPTFCGLFRTPTLRNVALRQTFFHNGKFHSLKDVVDFYVTRDITPARWYGKSGIYDDLPKQYRANLNRDPPFEDQHPGAKPRLNRQEIDDVVAFMQTLTDGFVKSNPYREERAAR
ncbi:MAG TPA: cytochrome c peroxidase [Rudaea sp.]|jgi:cytochrome c peroxidase|nr:cytochrome c peroxidase [Rudaea sp.]